MKSIIEDILQYDFIKPVTPFKPLGPISNLEIHPIKKEPDGTCEQCDIDDAEFWSIYVRYDPAGNSEQFGGVDCIADCADYDGAVAFASLLAGLLQIPFESM